MTAKEIASGMKIFEEWKRVHEDGYKSFLIFQNEKDFYEKISEEVYSIFDSKGTFIGDLLESDYLEFYDKDIIINTNEYVLQGAPDGYPIEMANYFVSKDHVDSIAQIKKKRCIIIILDEPTWRRQI